MKHKYKRTRLFKRILSSLIALALALSGISVGGGLTFNIKKAKAASKWQCDRCRQIFTSYVSSHSRSTTCYGDCGTIVLTVQRACGGWRYHTLGGFYRCPYCGANDEEGGTCTKMVQVVCSNCGHGMDGFGRHDYSAYTTYTVSCSGTLVPMSNTLTFNASYNGGSSDSSVSVNDGSSYNISNKSAFKSGYTFLGWHTSPNSHSVISNTVVTPTTDTTYYAIYMKRLINTWRYESSEFGTPSTETTDSFLYNTETSTTTARNSSIDTSAIEGLTESGNILRGWTSTAQWNNLVTFPHTISNNVTYTAVYKKNFDIGVKNWDDSDLAPISSVETARVAGTTTFNCIGSITCPAEPDTCKYGYKFKHWVLCGTNKSDTEAHAPGSTISGVSFENNADNVYFKAVIEPQDVTIRINYDTDGEKTFTQKFDSDYSFLPEAKLPKGYSFVGYLYEKTDNEKVQHSDEGTDQLLDKSDIISKEGTIDIAAKYSADNVSVTLHYPNDGVSDKTVVFKFDHTVDVATEIPAPDDLAGYTVIGVNTDRTSHVGLTEFPVDELSMDLYRIIRKDLQLTWRYEDENNAITSVVTDGGSAFNDTDIDITTSDTVDSDADGAGNDWRFDRWTMTSTDDKTGVTFPYSTHDHEDFTAVLKKTITVNAVGDDGVTYETQSVSCERTAGKDDIDTTGVLTVPDEPSADAIKYGYEFGGWLIKDTDLDDTHVYQPGDTIPAGFRFNDETKIRFVPYDVPKPVSFNVFYPNEGEIREVTGNFGEILGDVCPEVDTPYGYLFDKIVDQKGRTLTMDKRIDWLETKSLFAVFSPKDIDIILNYNNDEGTTKITRKFDSTFDIDTLPEPVLDDGYDYVGLTTILGDTEPMHGDIQVDSEEMTVYPIYKHNLKSTWVYENDGGVVNTTKTSGISYLDRKIDVDRIFDIDTQAANLTGNWSLKGWKTTGASSNDVLTFPIRSKDDVSFTAVYAQTVSVGGTDVEIVRGAGDENPTLNTALIVPETPASRRGYTFKGYNLIGSDDEDKLYQPDEEVTGVVILDIDKLNFKAVFEPNPVDVKINYENKGNKDEASVVFDSTAGVSLPEPIDKYGYDFDKFVVNGTDEYGVDDKLTVDDNDVITAKYTPKTVHVTVKLPDGCEPSEIDLGDKSFDVDVDTSLIPEPTVPDGMEFGGWTDEADGIEPKDTVKVSSEGEFKIYPIIECPVTMTWQYDTDDSTKQAVESRVYRIKNNHPVSIEPTEATGSALEAGCGNGWSFNNWASWGSLETPVVFPADVDRATDYVAIYKKTIKVPVYDEDGDVIGYEDIEIHKPGSKPSEYDPESDGTGGVYTIPSYTLPDAPTETKEGYTFKGYKVTGDVDSDAVYEANSTVSNIRVTDLDGMTIVPVWEPNPVRVTINYENKQGVEFIDKKYDETIELPEPVDKTGYNFGGYVDDKGNAVGIDKVLKGDITVDAVYEAKEVTIQIGYDNTGGVAEITLKYDDGDLASKLPEPIIPTGNHFVFFVDEEGNQVDKIDFTDSRKLIAVTAPDDLVIKVPYANEEQLTEIHVKFGDTITDKMPKPVFPDGNVLDGWRDSKGGIYGVDDGFMCLDGTELTPIFKLKDVAVTLRYPDTGAKSSENDEVVLTYGDIFGEKLTDLKVDDGYEVACLRTEDGREYAMTDSVDFMEDTALDVVVCRTSYTVKVPYDNKDGVSEVEVRVDEKLSDKLPKPIIPDGRVLVGWEGEDGTFYPVDGVIDKSDALRPVYAPIGKRLVGYEDEDGNFYPEGSEIPAGKHVKPIYEDDTHPCVGYTDKDGNFYPTLGDVPDGVSVKPVFPEDNKTFVGYEDADGNFYPIGSKIPEGVKVKPIYTVKDFAGYEDADGNFYPIGSKIPDGVKVRPIYAPEGKVLIGYEDEDGNFYPVGSEIPAGKKLKPVYNDSGKTTATVKINYKNTINITEVLVPYGKKLADVTPEPVAPEGYDVVGYRTADGKEYGVDDLSKILSDTSLDIITAPKTITIPIKYDNVEGKKSVTIKYGDDMSKVMPKPLIPEGKTQTGWVDEKGNKYPLDSAVKVSNGTTLVPYFEDGDIELPINYENKDGVTSIKVKYGMDISKAMPEPVVKTGYQLIGWELPNGGVVKATSKLNVPSGTVLTPKFTEIHYKLMIDYPNELGITSIDYTVKDNLVDLLPVPSVPDGYVLDGYTFSQKVGTYTSEELINMIINGELGEINANFVVDTEGLAKSQAEMTEQLSTSLGEVLKANGINISSGSIKKIELGSKSRYMFNKTGRTAIKKLLLDNPNIDIKYESSKPSVVSAYHRQDTSYIRKTNYGTSKMTVTFTDNKTGASAQSTFSIQIVPAAAKVSNAHTLKSGVTSVKINKTKYNQGDKFEIVYYKATKKKKKKKVVRRTLQKSNLVKLKGKIVKGSIKVRSYVTVATKKIYSRWASVK